MVTYGFQKQTALQQPCISRQQFKGRTGEPVNALRQGALTK